MRKFLIGMTGAVALMLAGVFAWNAQATPLTDVNKARPGTSYSLVEKAGCWLPGLPGECEIGQHKVCDRFHNKGCKCAPCPGWYPWRDSKPAH
jgi:hypothetical protein